MPKTKLFLWRQLIVSQSCFRVLSGRFNFVHLRRSTFPCSTVQSTFCQTGKLLFGKPSEESISWAKELGFSCLNRLRACQRSPAQGRAIPLQVRVTTPNVFVLQTKIRVGFALAQSFASGEAAHLIALESSNRQFLFAQVMLS